MTVIPHPSVPADAAGFSLSDLAPDFDVLTELQRDPRRFRGNDSCLSLYRYPSMLVTNIDRLRAQLPRQVGRNPTMACCLLRGVEDLSADPHVTQLAALKRELDTGGHDADPEDWEDLMVWMRGYPYGLPSGFGAKYSLWLPQEITESLSTLSSSIGLSLSSVAVLAILSTRADQPSCHPKQRAQLTAMVARFTRRTRFRVRMGRALLSAFGG